MRVMRENYLKKSVNKVKIYVRFYFAENKNIKLVINLLSNITY